jgi:energy-coupling factor transporter transmembrane protein EcfT
VTSTNASTAISQWGVLSLFACLIERSTESTFKGIALSLPFAPLLILVHGLVNPSFEVDASLGGSLNYSSAGVDYALLTTFRIALLMLGFALWYNVRRAEFVAFTLTRSWLPTSVALALLQVTTLFRVFSHKVEAVILAQRSRGVPVDASIWNRVVYFPATVIPLVASVLIETDQRHRSLMNRGLGSGPVRIAYQAPEIRVIEVIACLLSAVAVAGINASMN